MKWKSQLLLITLLLSGPWPLRRYTLQERRPVQALLQHGEEHMPHQQMIYR